MSRPANTKRIKQVSLELRPCELEYLIHGHDFFDEINMDTIKRKWEAHKDFVMKHCKENESGAMPWAYYEFDKK